METSHPTSVAICGGVSYGLGMDGLAFYRLYAALERFGNFRESGRGDGALAAESRDRSVESIDDTSNKPFRLIQ